MMSVGLSSLPAIFLIASSSRILSYVMSIAIDEGPLDTMPNMSPSCTSSFEIFLNSSRIRPVLWNCRCRSSTKNRKIRPDTSFRGRLTGRMMPSGGGGGGGASTLFTRPPVTTVIDVMSCLTPSSKISNSSFLRSGTKLPFSSRTITSFVTRSMRTVKVGFCGWAGLAGAGGGGACAESPTTRATVKALDQKPFIFNLIRNDYNFSAGGSGERRRRRRLELCPVEGHARVLCFDTAPHLFVERRPADFDARRRAEPVENPCGSSAAPMRGGLDQIKMFVAAPVARDCEDRWRAGHFLFCARAGFFGAFRASSLAAAAAGLRR